MNKPVSRSLRAARLGTISFLPMLLLLAACGGSLRYQGKVIPGPVAVAAVAPPDDERLDKPGVGGVEIELHSGTGSRTGRAFYTTTSDESGNFEIVLGKGQHPGGPITVSVEGSGIFDGKSRTYLPTGDSVILLTVIERSTQD